MQDLFEVNYFVTVDKAAANTLLRQFMFIYEYFIHN